MNSTSPFPASHWEGSVELHEVEGPEQVPGVLGSLDDVVYFGEALPDNAWRAAERACADCDVMRVIGTAAEVYPAAGLVGFARSHGATIVVVNTQPTGANVHPDVEVIGPAGTILPALLG